MLPGSTVREFVETSAFARRVDAEGRDLLFEIQSQLLRDLEAGDIVRGTGGLRKARIADAGRGKGKRGGFRVIYLDLPAVQRTYLLAIYDKDEKDDLSGEEVRVLRLLVARLKEAAR